MPLQNRVDPFGAIVAVPERGTFTGNRGIIHDPAERRLLLRRWTTKAWIICVCEFRGRKRQVMGPGLNGNGSWTELFFLDEVTALAAGHRPCFYCRRFEAMHFARSLAIATEAARLRAGDLDSLLHTERLATGNKPTELGHDVLGTQADGVMVSIDGSAYAKHGNRLLPWSFSGYRDPIPLNSVRGCTITRITPKTTTLAIAGGYQPIWHPSAGT